MNIQNLFPQFTGFTRQSLRPQLFLAILAGGLMSPSTSDSAALSFGRGTATTVGSVRFSSSPDSATLTGAYTAPGVITGGLAIPENRIQYDVINSDQGPMNTWTVYYAPAVGP